MQYDQFIGQVQHRARLASSGEAVRATRATLLTLGERLFGGEAWNLAAQLPEEIKEFLEGGGAGESFDLPEFYARVSDKEGVDLRQAVFHARAVVSVLRDAVSQTEIQHALDQLPKEYNALFESVPGEDVRKAA
ncbi:MAG TPA: DUF2267 domain-containing protein [Armatimonadota bacterium]|jgi:uncharacterized protein (DUF2267 family)